MYYRVYCVQVPRMVIEHVIDCIMHALALVCILYHVATLYL